MRRFIQGEELASIVGLPDSEGGQLWMNTTGQGGMPCDRISIEYQNGQMDVVPWAHCETCDGKSIMVNLAVVESVEIKDAFASEDAQ